MSDGFEVDLTALVRAAEGVNGVIADMANNKVSNIGGAAANYGDDSLAGSVSDFCGRWEIGVEHLTNDARQISGRLILSALAYARAEHTNISLLTRLLRERDSADPAASQW